MLRKLASAGVVALLAVGAASAAPGATATLSSAAPGARHVGVTVILHADALQCGRLNDRSLTVALPHSMRVPGSIPAGDVRVYGWPVASANTDGTTIVLGLPAAKGIACDSIGPGIVRIQFAGAAGLGNPAHAGTYAFSVSAKPRGDVWHGSFAVRS